MVLVVLALLVPLLMLALILALGVFEDRVFRPGPPPPKDSELPPRSPRE